MKRMSIVALTCATFLGLVVSGCGGTSDPDTASAPQIVQRMMQSGVSRVVQGDAPASQVVSIAGYRDNYTIDKNQTTNVVTVTSKIDNSVTTYQNPSLIKFVDKWTSFDINGAPGQVYRLYQAAFNRTPDLPGLGFWIAANQNGRDLLGIASDFTVSNEFKTMYGTNPTHLNIVNSFYNNVLHRAGEPAGVTWWVGQMDSGASLPGVLYGFSDSAENKNNLAAGMQNGFDYVPFNPSGPIIPQASSYLNAKNIGIGPVTLPVSYGDNAVKFLERYEAISNGFALADFFHDGTLSMVAFTGNYVPQGSVNYGRTPGHAYFYKKDASGRWVDHTSDILKDQTGCITPRKVIVADFNGDGRPDVFVSCHGTDVYPLPPGYSFGEIPRFLMSQPDGSYKNVAAPINCYCHGAAAAELNTRGYADIVVADPQVHHQPFMLINNKDGTFTADYNMMPAVTAPIMYDVAYGKSIWSVELIDFRNSGRFDLWLGGTDDSSSVAFASTIFTNPADGQGFVNAAATVLPSAAGVELADNNPLDITFLNGQIYLSRVNQTYTEYSIQKIDFKSLSQSMLYQTSKPFSNTNMWVDWLIPYNNQVVALNGIYPVAVK